MSTNDSAEVTESDVNRLRTIIFSSKTNQIACQRFADQRGSDARKAKHETDCQHQHLVTRSESESGLPSVVPDSDEGTNIQGVCHDHLQPLSSNAVHKLQEMNSPADLADGTQILSQSIYDALIQKEKLTRNGYQNKQSSSQRTYEEGDSGHIDIMSSFITRHDHEEDAVDSEPIESSPLHSQQQLTQFPESQRFKTPATAGKKRNHHGDVIDTPAPARNPFVRNGHPTPDGLLGLSQAFAATQAASSPLSNGLPTGPRSDRPSPNIELQTRPASASSSSPLLRSIKAPARAVTEPASRYKSVRQSQAERNKNGQQKQFQDENSIDVHALYDEFEEEDSLIARTRRRKERAERTKIELKSLSSPILSADGRADSSPVKAHPKSLSDNRDAQSLPDTSPNAIDGFENNGENEETASEVETEQEDVENDEIAYFSDSREADEDDKENDSVLVPKTGPRQPRLGFGQNIAQIDASPSLRQTSHTYLHLDNPNDREPHSSEPFRVMDSQPSQSRTRATSSTKINTSSISDVVDFAEHLSKPIYSNAEILSAHDENLSNPRITRNEQNAERQSLGGHTMDMATNTESVSDKVQHNTIPETSSELRNGTLLDRSALTEQGCTSKQNTEVTEHTYETAQTHIEPLQTVQSSQRSSPVRTTPPGRRRRRLIEISAEPSPRKSQPQLSFDAGAVLQLDDDQAVVKMLESSPQTSHNAKNMQHVENNIANSLSNEAVGDSHHNKIHIITPEMSQEVVKPGRQKRTVQNKGVISDIPSGKLVPSLRARPDVFDIQPSPEQRIPPDQLDSKPKGLLAARDFRDQKNVRASPRGNSRMERRLRAVVSDHECLASSVIPSVSATSHTERTTTEETRDTHMDKRVLDEVVAPSMVFAHYKGQPRGYYPARFLAVKSNDRYLIQWEGYDPDEVDVYGIKALDLHIGDTIKVIAEGFAKVPYIICGFKNKVSESENVITDIRGYRTLMISPKRAKAINKDKLNNKQFEVSISSVYLDTNMWAQMKLREHDIKPAATLNIMSGITTPYDRALTPSTPSSRGRRHTAGALPVSTLTISGIFTNMAFAISYDDTAHKNSLCSLIQTNGGFVINDSFYDLVELDSMLLKSQYGHLGFTALLTDRHSRKEKYMQALALGLPCLSGKWVESCAKHNELLSWHSYLLPAGECAELDNATRSRVLPPIDMATVKLSEMLQSRPKAFDDVHVIAVVGRGKAEAKRLPYLFLLYALGVSKIHKVPDIKSAAEFLASDHDRQSQWLFVEDKDVEAMQNLLASHVHAEKTKGGSKARTKGSKAEITLKVAGNELILQSLILGKLYEC